MLLRSEREGGERAHVRISASATRSPSESVCCQRSHAVQTTERGAARAFVPAGRGKVRRSACRFCSCWFPDRGKRTALVRIRCFFCTQTGRGQQSYSGAIRKDVGLEGRASTHLVHLGDSLGRPRPPSEHDHPLSHFSRTRRVARGFVSAIAIDEVDHLVGEGFPAPIRVRTGFVRRDGQGRVEEEDARAG